MVAPQMPPVRPPKAPGAIHTAGQSELQKMSSRTSVNLEELDNLMETWRSVATLQTVGMGANLHANAEKQGQNEVQICNSLDYLH